MYIFVFNCSYFYTHKKKHKKKCTQLRRNNRFHTITMQFIGSFNGTKQLGHAQLSASNFMNAIGMSWQVTIIYQLVPVQARWTCSCYGHRKETEMVFCAVAFMGQVNIGRLETRMWPNGRTI